LQNDGHVAFAGFVMGNLLNRKPRDLWGLGQPGGGSNGEEATFPDGQRAIGRATLGVLPPSLGRKPDPGLAAARQTVNGEALIACGQLSHM
jgi:hypothetical protein